MTAQMSDIARYQGKDYALAGVRGEGMFSPEAHGLQPRGTCTACWRGYVCTYAVTDETLLLDQLAINLGDPKIRDGTLRSPLLNGVERASGPGHFFDSQYVNVGLVVAFSGGLLIARGFIKELYVHMGFHPAWKYEEVHELLFDRGRLTKARDVSAMLREFRESMRDRQLEPGHEASRRDIAQWVERCFSLDYRM